MSRHAHPDEVDTDAFQVPGPPTPPPVSYAPGGPYPSFTVPYQPWQPPQTDPEMFAWAYENPLTAPHLLAEPGYVPPPPHVCYVPFWHRWWFWVIVAVCFMAIVGNITA